MAKINKSSSRYSNTPVKDFYLDLWVSKEISTSVDDQMVEITSKYHLRPDKMSYDFYGTPRLWWVFAMVNKDLLLDPINDFEMGTVIRVPSRTRVETEVV